jgi:UDP-N-acetylglucosamine 1-carboxyvinyltransferase
MDCLVIDGGRPLCGSVSVSGAKNAALPIMAASLLAHGPVYLERIPQLTDVAILARVLERLGTTVEHNGGGLWTLETPDCGRIEAHARLMQKMRASFCVLGPLLARRGRAVAALPGGCKIGDRPIDLHLSGLAALGAEIRVERGYVVASAKRLRGATVSLVGPRGPTVTGTANVLCAATLARGTTTIVGAAREPEIVDLGRFLIALGARIDGLGAETIEIQGVDHLHGARHEIIPDRIEAATLLLAGAITGGSVRVTQVCPSHLASVLQIFEQMGLRVDSGRDWIRLAGTGGPSSQAQPAAVEITARPYPGLPTDLQAQLTALLSLAAGKSVVRDCVFPHRFQHVPQLERMGANLRQHADGVSIEGVSALRGARLNACDLRASAALVLAGLAAHGRTTVHGIRHLDRGYEHLEQKLGLLGASIARVRSEPKVRRAVAISR